MDAHDVGRIHRILIEGRPISLVHEGGLAARHLVLRVLVQFTVKLVLPRVIFLDLGLVGLFDLEEVEKAIVPHDLLSLRIG